ncbi:MAG: hypothetical protein ABJA60_07855, partial [Nitrosospira sp.]
VKTIPEGAPSQAVCPPMHTAICMPIYPLPCLVFQLHKQIMIFASVTPVMGSQNCNINPSWQRGHFKANPQHH